MQVWARGPVSEGNPVDGESSRTRTRANTCISADLENSQPLSLPISCLSLTCTLLTDPIQVWARGPVSEGTVLDEEEKGRIAWLQSNLTEEERHEVTQLCARCLFGTLFKAVDMTDGGKYVNLCE